MHDGTWRQYVEKKKDTLVQLKRLSLFYTGLLLELNQLKLREEVSFSSRADDFTLTKNNRISIPRKYSSRYIFIYQKIN